MPPGPFSAATVHYNRSLTLRIGKTVRYSEIIVNTVSAQFGS